MKKIAALLLIIAFGIQTFSQGIILLDFYINQSYIAGNKCVNRFRPMLNCNGKCQLAKKIKQQEQKEQQNPELRLSHKNEVVSSRSFFATAPDLFSIVLGNRIMDPLNHLIDYSTPVFHSTLKPLTLNSGPT